MASRVDTWWANSYPDCSIKNFESMPVFHRFRDTNRRPFVRGDENYKETLWRVDNCDIFEWFDRAKKTGEKFGHDRNSDTWFYEHWYMEGDIHVVVKTWLRRPEEWGQVIRYFPDYEIHISWNLSGNTKTYEEIQIDPNARKGLREGLRNTQFGVENFSEAFWDSLDSSGLEKNWKRGTAQGGEKEYKKGPAKSGESWIEDKDYYEKREWKIEGTKNTGVFKGKKGAKTWEEKWDQDTDHDIDDKSWTEGSRQWGLLKTKRPDQQFKLEWEGDRPVIGGSGEDGYVKGRLVLKLAEVYRNIKEHINSSHETLEELAAEAPSLAPEVNKATQQLNSWTDPDFDDPDSIMQKINDFNKFDSQLEDLKLKAHEIAASERIELKHLEEIYSNCDSSANSLLPLIKPEKAAPFYHEREDILRSKKSAKTAKDLYRIVHKYQGFSNYLITLIGASSNEDEDESLEETMKINKKLENVLKEFSEVLKSSSTTLSQIESNFKPNDEVAQHIIASQNVRLHEISHGIETGQRYNIILDQVQKLLKDQENFKRELMSEEIPSQLIEIHKLQEFVSKELAKALDHPELESLKKVNEEELIPRIFPLVNHNKRQANLIRALSMRLFGIDEAPEDITEDTEEIYKSIKKRKPGEAILPIDTIALLKFIRFNGQEEQKIKAQAIEHLKEVLETDEEKEFAQSLVDRGNESISGQTPDNATDALTEIKGVLEEYLQASSDQITFIEDILGKTIEKDEGKSKKPGKGRQVKVRSKKGGNDIDITEKATKALNDSYDTIVGYSYIIHGNRPHIQEKLDQLAHYKQLVSDKLNEERTTADTVEDIFGLLGEYEKEKRDIITSSDLFKNLFEILDKTDKLIQHDAKIFNSPIPSEVDEIKARKQAEDLNDLVKRIKYFINVVLRMTGISEESENYEEVMDKLKKQHTASLPFKPEDLLHSLRTKKDKDLEVLKFLGLLVGSDEVLGECQALIKEARDSINDHEPETSEQALEFIEEHLSTYPSLESSVNTKTKQLLDALLKRLTNSDPNEKDFEMLQNTIEVLNLTSKKLLKSGNEESDRLESKKEQTPTEPSEVIPYLISLISDWAKLNLKLVAEKTGNKVTEEEHNEIKKSIAKLMRANPLAKIREIQPFFAAPDTNDMVSMIVLLDKAIEILPSTSRESNKKAYKQCKKAYKELQTLQPHEVGELGNKYSTLLIQLLEEYLSKPIGEFLKEIEKEKIAILEERKNGKPISTHGWDEILKGSGIDIDVDSMSSLIDKEQMTALPLISNIVKYFGTEESKIVEEKLKKASEDVLNEEDKSKIEKYISLRLEQTKFLSGLNKNIGTIGERLREMDAEKSRTVKAAISETLILIGSSDQSLLDRVNALQETEASCSEEESTNLGNLVIRYVKRNTIEKELQKIREQCKPQDNSEAEMIEKLREIETREYKALKTSYSTLQNMVTHLNPAAINDLSSIKSLTDLSDIASTIPSLISSIMIGIENSETIEQRKQELLSQGPLKAKLEILLKLLVECSNSDNSETDNVFSGLFRLCGSSEDKAKFKELKESKSLQLLDPQTLWELIDTIDISLNKSLPKRLEQSNLQNKLVKSAGSLRDSADEIDIQTEDLVKKAIREIANTISADDTRTRENFNKLKKTFDDIEAISPVNIPEVNDKTVKRLEQWEKLERLRREIRERMTKDINKLKGDIQEKLNEIESARAVSEAKKIQYEAQLHFLQTSADQNAQLVEKLTQESSEKEKVISEHKIKIAELEAKLEEINEDFRKSEEELEDSNKELRNIRKANKEKDNQIRELQGSLDGYERSSRQSFQGDKEKAELLDTLKAQLSAARDELASRAKQCDELDDSLKSTQREVQKALNEKAELEKTIGEMRGEINEMKLNILKLETTKNELEEKVKLGNVANPEEIAHLERYLEDKDKALSELEEQLEYAKKYQQLYLLIKDEKDELDSKTRTQEIDIEDLQRKIKELTAENEQLKYKTRQLDKLTKEVAAYQKETQKLQNKINYLEEFSGESSGDIQEAINKMTAEVSSRDAQILDLTNEIEELKAKYDDLEKRHQLAMNRNFLIRLCNSFKNKQNQYFKKWQHKLKEPKSEGVDEITFKEVTVVMDEDLPESEKAVFEDANKEIANEDRKLIENNIIIESLRSCGFGNEKPMSYLNLFKFLEELMDKKFETDKKDLAERRQPRTMTEFLMEHLNRSFGIQKLALKQLASLIPALKQLFDEGHKYAEFYCRLFQIFHPEPANYNLSIYLAKARVSFQPLTDKLDKTRALQNKGKTATAGKTHGRAAYDAAGSGGFALLNDVIELLYSMFSFDRESGTLALELIKPESVSDEDFVAYKICHKMAKLGKTPEAIFNMLDKDAGGTIDVNEFITGTRDDLDLWITDKVVGKFMASLAGNENGEISKETFMKKINMKNLMEWNRSDDWVVTKASFLNALVDVFKAKQRKDTTFLYSEFEQFSSQTINKDQFSEQLLKYDKLLTMERLNDLYEEAKSGSDDVSVHGFVKVIMKYGIGGYGLGAFMIRELLETLSSRAFYVDANLDEKRTTEAKRKETRKSSKKP
ncbi:unnamed protein product [Blepharisma stoltei]|uniref:EF-hand domain-containing protein n=1 Tax=Blepharisma stoltei TaxID=1481888 RepID=A0AAU9KNV0_9CILI|nr:unnamed protein product [Blepharisma stoltei]